MQGWSVPPELAILDFHFSLLPHSRCICKSCQSSLQIYPESNCFSRHHCSHPGPNHHYLDYCKGILKLVLASVPLWFILNTEIRTVWKPKWDETSSSQNHYSNIPISPQISQVIYKILQRLSTWLSLETTWWALKKYSCWGSDPWNVDFIGFMVGALIFAERSPSDSNEYLLSSTIFSHFRHYSSYILVSLLWNPRHTGLLAVSQTTRHTPTCLCDLWHSL